MLKKLPVYVSIIVAVAVIIIGLALGIESFEIIKRVVIFITVFFVISYILQIYLNKNVFFNDKNTDELNEDGQKTDEDVNNNIDFDSDLRDNINDENSEDVD